MKTIAIYTRKSKATNKGESIENQINLCKNYISKIFFEDEVKIEIYDEGEGFSGGDSTRKKFNELIQDAKKGKYDVLICYRLDRVARSVADFSDLIEELNRNNISFISVKEQFDTTTPMGRAMMYIASVFAQLEREIGAERIRDNMRELAKTGRWLGGTTPTGYESVGFELMNVKEYNENNEVVTKVKKAFMLKKIDEEIYTVKTLFQKFLNLKSLTALETYALNNNIKTKNNIYFSRFALKTILTNPVYAKNDLDMYNYFKENNVDVFSNKEDFDGLHGIMAYNKTLQVKHKAIRKKDIHQWIVACGKHKGIIDGRDWIYVQNILNINKQKSYRKPKKNTAILTGMIFCKECGSPMRPRIQTGRLYKDGTEKYVYSCTLKEKSRRKKCTGKNINGNEIDTLLLEKIKKIIVPNQKICDELKKIANTKADIVDENDEFISLKSKYDKNQKDLENLIQKIRYVDIDLIDDINKEVKKIKKENEEISVKLNKYNEEKQISKLEVDVAQIVLEIIENHFNKFNKLDIMEQKALLRLIINKVSGNGDTVEVNLLTDNSSAFFNSILLPSGENSK